MQADFFMGLKKYVLSLNLGSFFLNYIVFATYRTAEKAHQISHSHYDDTNSKHVHGLIKE